MTRLTTNTATPAGPGRYLLTKADAGQLAFGSPHLFKATASDTVGRFDFMVEAFAPMTGPPLHFHEVQDDTFYVLEGLDSPGRRRGLGPRGGRLPQHPTRSGAHLRQPAQRRRPRPSHQRHDAGMTFPMIEDMARVPPGPEQPDGIKAATRRHGTLIVGPPLRVTLGLD